MRIVSRSLPLALMLLVQAGHEVMVESGAGEGSGFKDEEFLEHGAHIHSFRSRCVGQSGYDFKSKRAVERGVSIFS